MIFSRLFHQLIRTQELDIPKDRNLWPQEWKQVDFKQYKRFPEILLPEPTKMSCALEEALGLRTSSRVFDEGAEFTLQELSTILHFGFGLKVSVKGIRESTDENLAQTRRYYPSGGARYPLEVYIFIHSVSGVDSGVYHYDIANHSLRLIGCDSLLHDVSPLLHKNNQNPKLIMLLSMKQERNAIKYKEHGYDMLALECGHAAQNALLVSAALSKKSYTFFGYDIKLLADVLGLDEDELIFYAIMFG
jgi:SagB-type dehydrogenase family enzyme